jgi:hypothetical protein
LKDDAPTKLQQSGKVKDARGRVVTQLDPVIMQHLHRPGVIEPQVLRRIADEVGVGLTKASRVGFWLILIGLVGLALALVVNLVLLASQKVEFSEVTRRLTPFSGTWFGLFILWVSARGARHQRITKIMLAHHLCPHCGYDLRLLPPDPADGATVCPECGCAWQITIEG